MTKLILVRHGESMSNFLHTFTGQSDIPLTERGHEQAKAAAQYIKKNEKISAVYASPLKRAFDTGKHIAEALSVPIIAHDGLMELDGGEWEGKCFDDLEIQYPESYHTWCHDIGNACPDGGESITKVFKRCLATVNEIVKANPDTTVVLATHAVPIRALTTYWLGIDITDMKTIPWSSNASLTEICYNDKEGFFNLKADIREHLDGITTVLASNV